MGQTDSWTSQDYIFESKVKLWTGLLYAFLLIRAQREFLSCESQDKGHWVNSKLTVDLLWFRGLSPVCTHKTVNAPPIPLKRDPPIYWGIFHLTLSKPRGSSYCCVWEFPKKVKSTDSVVLRIFTPRMQRALTLDALQLIEMELVSLHHRGVCTWLNAKRLSRGLSGRVLSHSAIILFLVHVWSASR